MVSTASRELSQPFDPEYLRGVDLYNRGAFWEAHEAWEGLWRRAQDDLDRRAFYQGLIQCAAACLKRERGDSEASRRLALRGLAHLARIRTGGDAYLGLDVPRFSARFRAYACADAGEYPLLEVAR